MSKGNEGRRVVGYFDGETTAEQRKACMVFIESAVARAWNRSEHGPLPYIEYTQSVVGKLAKEAQVCFGNIPDAVMRAAEPSIRENISHELRDRTIVVKQG